MRKHLPNILLLSVVLVNLFFMGSYIRNNGFGLFLSTTGIVFLILGVVIFVYFLSIDPGYGWTKSIDLTKNYIMIFTSMAVGITGAVFIVSGQHLHDLHAQKIAKQTRCQELVAGNVAEVLKNEWYSLRDQKYLEPFSIYLFQKKSNRNNFKILVTAKEQNPARIISNLIISSKSLTNPITVDGSISICPGVYESSIDIGFEKHQKLNEPAQFNIILNFSENVAVKNNSKDKEQSVQFTLQNKNPDQLKKPRTQVSTQAKEHNEVHASLRNAGRWLYIEYVT